MIRLTGGCIAVDLLALWLGDGLCRGLQRSPP